MAHKDIINRAARIVRYKLDGMDANNETVNISKDELISISTALAVASVLCRVHYESGDKNDK